ncbi:hypothetical protein [Aliivibrio fischeri]|uniref:hypothetical protein n=1 Tax=Aliivibrio fischeri TaxID=668 RepID=UPI0012DABDD8|nr:hypothetical protein [Aliivibrio fischeri]MUL11526.1 hypothetical protein [Aliivibrio fischeri]MUL15496.1 hypothetical protein [Aliivibrio fischeri]
MSKNFSANPKKTSFLSRLPQDTIDTSDIADRCKFNFSYLDTNQIGQNFIDWNDSEGDSKLVKLTNKLKDFTRQSLGTWKNMKIGTGKRGGKGKRQSCLEIYGDFPSNSAFTHPAHVPDDVLWARFRLDNEARLIGFILPDKFLGQKNSAGQYYDTNTFYVVFLDEHHQFYQS